MDHIFALVDCNNFYASCERVFNPKLEGKPVVVLSNNDGCIIARSNEAKDLGIKMGEPYYKLNAVLAKLGVNVFSSNYALYGDMSQRVMETLKQFTPNIEVYSIDEAFLDFNDLYIDNFAKYLMSIKTTVKQWTGMPVSVGVGPTKTLAKLANHIAKKNLQYQGVFDLGSEKDIDSMLDRVKVCDIWGIGRRYNLLLTQNQVDTALDLKNADLGWIRKKMTIVGERMVRELRGEACYGLDENPASKKSIVSSRSFAREVETKEDLGEALSQYVSIAAEKLRSQKSLTSFISVFLHTNYFKEAPQYSNCAGRKFLEPTSSTSELAEQAMALLDKIYKKGYKYKKIGIYFTGIMLEDKLQYTLFNPAEKRKKSKLLMKTMDDLNNIFGDDTVKIASQGTTNAWKTKQAFKSKKFTTRWSELAVVK